MLRIAICEDDQNQTAYLCTLAKRWAVRYGIPVTIRDYASAEQFLFERTENPIDDILLLDIQLGMMDGVSLAKTLRRNNDGLTIIFITATADYALDGYDIGALHYLTKPLDEKKFFNALTKAHTQTETAAPLLVETNDGRIRIAPETIYYMEAFNHYVAIVTDGGTIKTGERLYALAQAVGINEPPSGTSGNGFTYCHRSYIVGLRHVKCIGKSELTLDNGTRLPVSRRIYHALNQAFIQYYKGV